MINKLTYNDNKIIENFFNIWVLKELIYDDRFEKYYDTFIDDNGIFSAIKLEEKLKEIYDFISKYDVTSDGPNKIGLLKKPKIKYILEKSGSEYEYGWGFSDDLNIQIMGGDIKMILEGGIKNYEIRKNQISDIKNDMISYLDGLYHNGIYNIGTKETIEDIIKKIIKIINKK